MRESKKFTTKGPQHINKGSCSEKTFLEWKDRKRGDVAGALSGNAFRIRFSPERRQASGRRFTTKGPQHINKRSCSEKTFLEWTRIGRPATSQEPFVVML
jgi:hypothetical protein